MITESDREIDLGEANAQARLETNRAALRPPPMPATVPIGQIAGRMAARASSEEHRAAVAAEQERAAAAARRTLLSLAREREIPEEEDLREIALADAPPQTLALATFHAAVEWRGGRRRGCVVVAGGDRGTGKSCAMAHVLLRSEASALYVQAPDIAATPRNGFSEHLHRWDRWLSVPVLGLDDLGTESGEPEVIAGLLWQRYDRGLLTFCTTNLARSALIARYFAGEIGKRLVDRLLNAQGRRVGREMGPGGLAWYVAVRGESLRNRAARAALEGAL